jgi:hypothetical protein
MATKATAPKKPEVKAKAKKETPKVTSKVEEPVTTVPVKVSKIEEAKAKKCLQRIEEGVKGMADSWYDVSIAMKDAYENGYAEICGYENFRTYVEGTLDIKYRMAMYFVNAGKTLVRLDIPKERVAEIGITKFKEVVPMLEEITESTKNEDRMKTRTEKLLNMAETKSSRELADELRRTPKKEAQPEKLRLSCKFEAEQGRVVSDALAIAAGEIGNTEVSNGLNHICSEWVMMKGTTGGRSSIEDHIKYLEKTFEVKLTVTEGGKKTSKTKEAEKSGKKIEKQEAVKAPEPEQESAIDLDALDRKGLEAFVKKHDLDVSFTKKTTDDQLRDMIVTECNREPEPVKATGEKSAEQILGL